jgi:GAG-pre-integrase domain
MIATILNRNGLYKIAANKQATQNQSANVVSGKMTISRAHRKLRHVSYGAIKHAVSKGFINGITINPDSKPNLCGECAKAKSAQQPFPQESNTRAKKYGEQVHWNLWGPASVKSLSGNSYMAACIDNATHESKLYFQQKKSQLFQSYKKDKAYIETQSGNHIKVSCSDRGGEFQSEAILNHQDQRGTVCKFTVHDLPPQNGVSERGMRTQAERARALLLASGLPRFLWKEAMSHSNWLQN